MADRSEPPTLEPRKFPDEDVWYVQVLWPDGRSEQVGAFRNEAETQNWITGESGAWLKDYERRRSDPGLAPQSGGG